MCSSDLILWREIEQVAQTRRHTLEVPDVSNRGRKLDMTHALAANLRAGDFNATALASDNIVVVPIASGVGARLGVNMGYLKFTKESTWNPF